MEKQKLIYEGKAKNIYETDDNTLFLAEYIDQATALNGLKKDYIKGKGQMNNQITSLIFEKMKEKGIPNHFVGKVSKTEQLIKKVKIFPLEIVVRNITAGSFCKRLGLEEGLELPFPIIEFYYKDDSLDDPFINEEHIKYLAIATETEIQELKDLALKVNQSLSELFTEIGIKLVDFKIEVGKLSNGELLLADEISPDTCRLWDEKTNEHLDKDVYRRDLGDIIPIYQEVLERLEKTVVNKGL